MAAGEQVGFAGDHIGRASNFVETSIGKSQQHPRASRAVPHPSTDRAFGGLSSEFEWDREFSTEYGRWRTRRVAEGSYAHHYQGGFDLVRDDSIIAEKPRNPWGFRGFFWRRNPPDNDAPKI